MVHLRTSIKSAGLSGRCKGSWHNEIPRDLADKAGNEVQEHIHGKTLA